MSKSNKKLTPVDRYLRIVRVIRFFVGFCGNDVADPNFKMWWLTYLVLSAIGMFLACTGYTIYRGVVIDGDLTVILQAMAMVGSALQGLTKLLVTANLAPLLRHIQYGYEDIYREYGAKSGEYIKCLERIIKITWRIMISFFCPCLMNLIAVVSFPIFYLVVYKKKIMVMQFLMPLIDEKTDTGYMILSAVHVGLIFFGSFGNYGGDMYLFLFVTNLTLIKDIFCVKLKELNEVVLKKNEYEQMRVMLFDLVTWHQKYQNILLTTRRIYSFVLFVQLSTTCISMLCTIACIFLRVWPAAPIYLLYSATTLYAFCGLGTAVEISNDVLIREIYSGCLWYELPVKEEKIIILMLAKAQTEQHLTAANMCPLSMNTALQLTKGIYSFSMMLLTYLGLEK
ncbi:uncharacterized protein Dana_GF10591 [Drosophila ananassae]|uniref:Odorant receptor n=1 Tax=Drosophila ananassae TaxID=7217 RepID=B3M5A6_DROAN|nr:odorant receptor 67d [Drosophila ananassae]EDV40611.1 uncharacterized protein Dana_GF10591 [Drosophila ananassae]